MIKYNLNNINDWNFDNANINKVYYGVTSGTPLPYDAEIEYLESSGTQYINTNKYVTNSYNFEVGYELASVLTEKEWGWVHQMVANGAWVNVNDKYAFFGKYKNSNWVVISGLTSSTENTVVYKSNSGVTVNGTFISKTLSLDSVVDNITTVPLHIFCNYDFNSRAVDIGNGTKLKSFYLKVDDTLVLDLIPVRVGQVGYMYDKVSGELFGNSGTGDFILGADKTTPLPSTTVGNVVYQKITTGGTPTQFLTLGELIEIYPTGTTQAHVKSFTNYSDVSGITHFRFYPSKGTTQSQYVYSDHNADNATGTTKFPIKGNSDGDFWSAVDGQASLKNAANNSSCLWAYWVDSDTIEVDVVAAVGTTIFIKQWQDNFPTDIIAYKFGQ